MDSLLQMDGSILLLIQEYLRHPAMDGFWKAVTFLGNGGWFFIALTAVLFLFAKTRRLAALEGLSLLIGALMTNVLLKPLVARTRPYELIAGLMPLIEKPSDFSFPSGHTTAAFAFAFVAWKQMPRRYGVCFMGMAVLIACSRLYLGVHYPSDVVCGVLVAYIASKLALWLSERLWAYYDLKKKLKNT